MKCPQQGSLLCKLAPKLVKTSQQNNIPNPRLLQRRRRWRLGLHQVCGARPPKLAVAGTKMPFEAPGATTSVVTSAQVLLLAGSAWQARRRPQPPASRLVATSAARTSFSLVHHAKPAGVRNLLSFGLHFALVRPVTDSRWLSAETGDSLQENDGHL